MPDTSDLPRADATRARLLKAAVTAFAEKGFHGTTTRDIATAAGMSPAALYVHHRSKEELLFLISKSGHDRTLRLVREGIAESTGPVEALRRVVRDFVVHHARDNTGARIVNYELSALSPGHMAEIREIRRTVDGEIRALVERGVAEGVFDTPHPKIAATALLSLGIDIARWYRTAGEWTPEDIATGYVELALRIVGARP
ncbi:TetR family transcriptional regulator [Actinocorallia herbida]|uniref:TetR family transcriptional regulator n=1 Tax=Actinocorallia herbida TaxID=58109 RepID=A0A3N1CXG2_9ACTN|nr:TetR/AcrR family transcriptional regulator [Actinocorallia herbida]ROO85964.1 TetR family transcriptional regulator [Actinocorallia herbida]